jgi:lipid-binding SYLF domain-containing protein
MSDSTSNSKGNNMTEEEQEEEEEQEIEEYFYENTKGSVILTVDGFGFIKDPRTGNNEVVKRYTWTSPSGMSVQVNNVQDILKKTLVYCSIVLFAIAFC